MAWLNCSIHKPVKRFTDSGNRPHLNKAAVLHTAVSSAVSLFDFWNNRSFDGAHFYINEAGVIEQYADTVKELGHAWDANSFTVGIESWDDAKVIGWNAAQLTAIDTLLRELGCPAKKLLVGPSDGVGYHRLYPSWNQSNHSCPGDPRVAQFAGILTRLSKPVGGGDDDMVPQAQIDQDAARRAGYTAALTGGDWHGNIPKDWSVDWCKGYNEAVHEAGGGPHGVIPIPVPNP